MTTPVSNIDPADYANTRESAAETIMYEIDWLLIRLHTNESGRLLEAVVQLLSERIFTALALIVVGYERTELVRTFVYQLAIKIAIKTSFQPDFDQIAIGASNVLAIINCENLRRKGYMEYSWPNDIFTDIPTHTGYNKLTAKGVSLSHEYLLMNFNSKTIQ